MAHIGQEPRRVMDGVAGSGGNWITRKRCVTKRDLEPLGRMIKGRAVACPERRGGIGRARIAPGGDVKQKRGVAHGAGQEARDRHPCPTFAAKRAIGKARAGGFEPKEPAGRGRNTHRAAAI